MDASATVKPRGISVAGLSRQEEQVVFNLLLSLTKQGQAQWRYAGMDHATALIVDEGTPDGRAAAQAFMRIAGRALVIVDGGLSDPANHRFALARPLTDESIKHVLHQLTDFLAHPLAPAPGAAASASTSNRLVDVLRNLSEEDGGVPAFKISGGSLASLLVSPKAKKVLFGAPWETLKTFDFSTPVEVHDVPVGDPLLPRLIVDGQPLHYLNWLTGLYSGQGTLLPCIDPSSAYKLKRWPEFGTVEFTPAFLKVMSFLSKHAATVPEIEKWTGFPATDICDLLNACALCGYLDTSAPESGPQAPTQLSEAAQEKRSLFNRIRMKLGLAPSGAAA